MSNYEMMDYIRCGNSGLKLPRMALGAWYSFSENDDYENMRALVKTAFENGITYFDLANNYGPQVGAAEINFGKILKQDFAGRRNELLIATKAGHKMWEGPYGDGGSRKYLLSSLEESLKRLDIDYIDIFYHHRYDPETPIMETMLALKTMVDSGKVLYAGISKYPLSAVKEALQIAKEIRLPLIVGQYKVSMLVQDVFENGVYDELRNNGIGISAFSSLSMGLLTDKYLHGIPEGSRMDKDSRFLKKESLTPQLIEALNKLDVIAKRRQQTLAQLALTWVLSKDVECIILGASKPSQILDNLKAIRSPRLTPEELTEIEGILSEL
ncbi:MAG TPA: L-glyceraldehyde 3-phosphate reductase [Erysipelotrichaceae bacterium]|nr:MAG: L-glyceraldehyde 3-phosphate reductase [Firmicutes bacterium GWE2_51_13]HAO61186.1 L-glyceraldehyde 3-phosphate reductase [Erysipelotrichaceae bacterium]HBZ42124.1 L-glyceraldehyde 3-phosphate reductase [Erysipelotrichaceae bacterium]